jgi:hypothetical protein
MMPLLQRNVPDQSNRCSNSSLQDFVLERALVLAQVEALA